MTVPWQQPSKRLRNSSSVSFLISKLFGKKTKISQKTQFLENQKNLSSPNSTPDLQFLNIAWQHPTIGLRNWSSNFLYLRFFISKFFFLIIKKLCKKRPISKTKKVSAVILRLQICKLWFYSDSTPVYCWEIEVRLIFFTSKIFEKKKNEKIIKNAISRKPKRFEQSNLDSRFATPKCTLTAPHYRVEKLKFG